MHKDMIMMKLARITDCISSIRLFELCSSEIAYVIIEDQGTGRVPL